MDIHVVPGDEIPIYRQIVRQVADGVAAGRFAPGARLPSQRELAHQLVVAPLTVKKAYDLLEQQGVVETHHGKGTFVAADAGHDGGQSREHLDRDLRQLVTQAWLSGLTDAELISLVTDGIARLRAERQASGDAPPTDEQESDA
jgi:GntR family transcriptional regulator